MEFTTAIVRDPCRNMVNGLTTANLGFPDYEISLKQHNGYINSLKSCGLTVHRMKADENYPDSCFIEDTAIVNEDLAVLCAMSEPSRSGEVNSVQLKLLEFYSQENICKIISPGTLDGGDIMRVENTYYVGLSNRTNLEGAKQFRKFLSRFGFSVEFVKFTHCLHLKSEVNYLGNGVLILSKEFQKNPLFQKYEWITVEKQELYAANSLRINKKVITPTGFPIIKQNLIDYGYDIIELNMSEFQKLDGGLSCLSLRF